MEGFSSHCKRQNRRVFSKFQNLLIVESQQWDFNVSLCLKKQSWQSFCELGRNILIRDSVDREWLVEIELYKSNWNSPTDKSHKMATYPDHGNMDCTNFDIFPKMLLLSVMLFEKAQFVALVITTQPFA